MERLAEQNMDKKLKQKIEIEMEYMEIGFVVD